MSASAASRPRDTAQESLRLMPDRRVETTGAADRAADEAAQVAARHEPRMAPADLYHLSDAVREAARNALEHSGDRRVIIKLQASATAVTLTVSDRGRGIPEALRRNSSLAGQDKDHILLRMATNPAVSSTGNPERGSRPAPPGPSGHPERRQAATALRQGTALPGAGRPTPSEARGQAPLGHAADTNYGTAAGRQRRRPGVTPCPRGEGKETSPAALTAEATGCTGPGCITTSPALGPTAANGSTAPS